MAEPQRCLWALDNIEGFARLHADSVALVYLDPPFNSGRSYGTFLSTSRTAGREPSGAFSDTWRWTDNTERTFKSLGAILSSPTLSFIKSLAKTMGRSAVTAYLVELAPRLAESHRVLRREGSLYLHCDPTASHYLKILLDHIFGQDNFRSEVIWKRTHAHSSSRRYGPIHDTILFYSKSAKYTWNRVFTEYADSYLENHFRQTDEQGAFQLITCNAPGDRQGTRAHYRWKGLLPPPGRHWAWKREQMELFEGEGRLVYSCNGVPRLKRYSHEGRGVAVQDVWLDINRLDSHSRERIGFETQKPAALLERIITASSNPGDLVLDPFSGSGTTAVAAERLGRRWIAIDTSVMACAIALARVRQEVNLATVALEGFPEDARDARRLLRTEPAAFGIWGTSMLGSIPDRQGTNATVFVGNGELSVRSQRIEILSWVPIGSRLEMAAPTPSTGRGKLAKLGVILRHNRSAATAQRWLQRNLNVPTHLVDIEHLVDRGAHQTGLSSRLPRLLRTAS